jgi:hypothetical protein
MHSLGFTLILSNNNFWEIIIVLLYAGGFLLVIPWLAALFILIFARNSSWRIIGWGAALWTARFSQIASKGETLEVIIGGFLLIPALVGVFTQYKLNKKNNLNKK